MEDIVENGEFQDELEVEKEINVNNFLENDSDEIENEESSVSTDSDTENKTDDSIDKENE